ncbi:hypothetical protein HY407_00070 [Candidatus Gottesmanbacteria bacterium]|nr:hypothetical protein [Candidatus Gottesmanbacteria bacterium]
MNPAPDPNSAATPPSTPPTINVPPPPPISPSSPNPPKSPLLLVLGGIIVIGIIATGAYFLAKSQKPSSSPSNPPSPSSPQLPISPSPDPTANWKTYAHSAFTFKYPINWYFQEVPDFPGGNNVSFFLVGTKADHGYGDHEGNEVFSFELSKDVRSLDELKRDYYKDAVDLIINDKQAIKTSFNLLIIKISEDEKLSIVGGKETAKPYLDQILSTFKFVDSPVSPTPKKISNTCTSDNQCSPGFFCDYGFNCAQAPQKGPGCTKIYSGSQKCIKKCNMDEDCSATESCQIVYVASGSDVAVGTQGCQ